MKLHDIYCTEDFYEKENSSVLEKNKQKNGSPLKDHRFTAFIVNLNCVSSSCPVQFFQISISLTGFKLLSFTKTIS